MLAETLSRKYSEELSERIVLHLETGDGDAYSSNLESGILHLRAKTPLGLAYACTQQGLAAKAGHLAEWLGDVSPNYSHRILWPGCGALWRLNDQVGIAIPHAFLSDSDTKRIAKRLIEWGYNTILFSCKSHEVVEEMDTLPFSLNVLVSDLQDCGLRVLIQPEILLSPEESPGSCPLKPQVRGLLSLLVEETLQAVPELDGVFWPSLLQAPSYSSCPQAKDSLISDLVSEELHLIEAALSADKELIFYVPCEGRPQAVKQTAWLEEFCDEAGPKTTIAFSATAGDPTERDAGWHPLWQALRLSPDSSATPLLPIINAGMVAHGEGLWPNIPLAYLEGVFQRMYRHHFAGAVVMGNQIAHREGMGPCALWAAGQRLWHVRGIDQLVESWICSMRPDWCPDEALRLMHECERIEEGLQRLWKVSDIGVARDVDTGPLRLQIEGLLGQLNALQLQNQSSLVDYMTFFVRDAKRQLYHILQRLKISMASVLAGDDLKESFWTKMDAEPSRGIVSGAKVTFLSQPNSGEAGSRLAELFGENWA